MIDDNVPIPPRSYGPRARPGPRTEAGRIAADMQPGQSHFFERHTDFNTARSALYERGASLRSEKRREKGVNGWRLWRVA